MSDLHDHGIDTTEDEHGVRYRFPIPARDRHANFFLLVVTLGVAVGVGYLFVTLLDLIWAGGLPAVAAVLCTTLLSLVIGLSILVFLTLATVFGFNVVGANEVRLRHGILWYGVSVGRLRFGSQQPVLGLRRFSVLPCVRAGGNGSPAPAASWDLFGVTVEDKSVRIHAHNSRGLLVALAEDLTKRCWGTTTGETAHPAPATQPLDSAMRPEPFRSSTGAPEGSRVRVEQFPDGVTVTVPPRGAWRVAPFNYVFGWVYLTAVVAAGGVLIWGTVTGRVRWNPWELEGAAGFVLLHASAAGYLVLDSLSRGARQAVLAVVGNELLYRHKGLFFSTEDKWHRGQIADLRPRVAAFGLEGRKHQSLELRLSSGRVEQLLEGYPAADLRWIATILRRSLGLPMIDPHETAQRPTSGSSAGAK